MFFEKIWHFSRKSQGWTARALVEGTARGLNDTGRLDDLIYFACKLILMKTSASLAFLAILTIRHNGHLVYAHILAQLK